MDPILLFIIAGTIFGIGASIGASSASSNKTKDKFEKKYTSVKEKLANSSVIREYVQPVILVGPRSVGKSSLLAQWHTPWDHKFIRTDTPAIYGGEEVRPKL